MKSILITTFCKKCNHTNRIKVPRIADEHSMLCLNCGKNINVASFMCNIKNYKVIGTIKEEFVTLEEDGEDSKSTYKINVIKRIIHESIL